ncbi:ATP-binding protein [Bradyrhizobium liaoningense]|uniref:ATP-binding protein n=1 Tax=Bradyrhizobium liaoningense TaxID=43992 RepID=UPI002010E13B|nr:ATP-binding protein [Bradyrhizobium liaoningense]
MTRRAKKATSPRKGRVGATLASPSLQGRAQDIALIDHLIERIDQGGSTLVISGEPGIGKSALLDVARHRANAASPS